MAHVITFPKDLERNFFRDLDRIFAIIWMSTFFTLISFTYYMQSLPVKPITAADVMKFTQAIRVTIAKPVVTPSETAVSSESTQSIAIEDEPALREEAEVTKKPLTQAEKDAARAEAREERLAEAEASLASITSLVKTITGPTARSRNSNRSGKRRTRVVKFAAGALGSSDIKDALAIVGDGRGVERVKELRKGGAITEDIGNLSISDLRRYLSDSDNLDKMLNEAKIKLSGRGITAKGRGSKKRQRSSAVVSQKIQDNKNQVVYCYWTYKRQDSSLKGQITIEFIIAPSGDVIAVNFKKSRWGGNPFRKDVERCIKNVILQWRFGAIGERYGNVTYTTTFMLQ